MIDPDGVIGGLVEDKWWETEKLYPVPQHFPKYTEEIKLKTIKEIEEEYREYRRVRGENINLRLTNDILLTKYKNLVTALENLLHHSEEMRSWHKSESLGETGARSFYELGASESYNDIAIRVEQILQNVVGVNGEDS